MELIGDAKIGVLSQHTDHLELARQIALKKTEAEADNSFMVVALDSILKRFQIWKRELPMIEPFYAVKCNTDPVLVRCLAALGTGFDCASREEIDIVMDIGVGADRIIYANPCKTRSFIAHALERNVKMMTFDNKEELVKISQLHTEAEMILRIAVSDPTATCPLNLKFGCDPVLEAPKLLKKAQELGVNVVGISFHVGSGCNDATAYRLALQHTKNLFDFGLGLGFNMQIIDLGGGFPGAKHDNPFEKIADIIRQALDEYFPEREGLRLIAEPGRFFAQSPFTLVANIITATEVDAARITKNATDSDTSGYMYYLNDGVYGSFNCILFDHVHPSGVPLFEEEEPSEEFPCCIWGPTCDSLDLIEPTKKMRKMEVGEWMVYENMGAYTIAAATTFNGFARPVPIYVISAEFWQAIKSSPHV